MNTGRMIREARERKGLTQLELAKLLGYDTPQFVSLFERGLSKVPAEVLGKLVLILGIKEEAVVNQLVVQYEYNLRKEMQSGKAAVLAKPKARA